MLIQPCIVLATILALTSRGVQCLHCLVCQDVPHARDCNEIKECGPSEMCYHETHVAQSGRLTRRLGCRDKLQCPASGSAFGRRGLGLERRAGDLILCQACCDTDFCQATQCGDKDFQKPHGPICFSCDKLLIDDCNTFQICGRDQICYETLAPSSGTADVLMEAGCYGKQACLNIQSALAWGKRSEDTETSCYNCCQDDLCNRNCLAVTTAQPVTTTTTTTTPTTTTTTTTTPAPPPVTTTPQGAVITVPQATTSPLQIQTVGSSAPPQVAMTTGATGGGATGGVPCVDKTEVEICKVAGQYVCNDRDKATNANCLNYCGYTC